MAVHHHSSGLAVVAYLTGDYITDFLLGGELSYHSITATVLT